MSSKRLEDLLKLNLNPATDAEMEDVCDLVARVDIDAESDVGSLRKAFVITKNALLKKNDECEELYKEYERIMKQEKQTKQENESLMKELRIRQNNETGRFSTDDPRELQAEISRLENRIEEQKNEMKEYELRSFQEKAEKDKFIAKTDELEKQMNKQRRDNQRLEEEVREYMRQIQHFREERFSRVDEETGQFKEKISIKNKMINELENENMRLEEENQRLNKFVEQNRAELQNATLEMQKTHAEIQKLRSLQQTSDTNIDYWRKENEILKSQVDVLNSQLASQHDQDAAIMNTVEARIKEFKVIIHDKEEEIKALQEIAIQLRESLGRVKMDSDKATVSALAKTIQDKDKQIEILKKQAEEYAREMDKSTAVINNLNKTFYENSKMYSKSSQYNAGKQAEQKIAFLESMLRDSEARFKDAEEHASEKEKELAQALHRLNEYESGDYQLQEAVNEIKGLKNQIKIRDRDIETLTKHLNKLDDTLGEVLEENDDLRAKLGMEPREKLNLDELSQLRAVRAHENRAVVHLLKRENAELEEERIKLKLTVRKLVKQLGSKVNVAAILEDGLDYYDIVESKSTRTSTTVTTTGKEKGGVASKENEISRRVYEQMLQDYENENKQLEIGLREIHQQLVELNGPKSGGKKGARVGETIIKCPTLDKLLVTMETHRTSRANSKAYAFLNQLLADEGGQNSVPMALKGEIDYLNGRNEELRAQLAEMRSELGRAQAACSRAQDEVDRLSGDVRIMNNTSSAKDIFQPFKLPPGMAPSSQDIISALNEYLLDTLQELEEYKKVSTMTERDLETLRRKYAVASHQMSLLYKEHIDESRAWKTEKERLKQEMDKLSGTIEVDAVKLQEYDRLLDTLERDENEVTRRLAESSRQMVKVRSSEKQLLRKCAALEETDLALIKENKKLRVDIIEMEMAVQQRIGYLERFKDMANFKIMSLHKQLEDSVPVSKLELVNRQYTEVVANYRQLLDKSGRSDALSESLHETTELNKKYEAEVQFLRKELENEKEKSHMLEESLNRLKSFQVAPSPASLAYAFSGHNVAAAAPAPSTELNDSGMLSMAKRLTAIEMKELNERQRADHAQRMYDEQRSVLRQLENRNLELEANFGQVNKLYLAAQRTEQTLREELANSVSRAISDADKARVRELEKQEHLLKLEVSRLRELTEITLYQTASLEFINNVSKAQLESFGLIDVQSLSEEASNLGRLHRQIILLQISEATAVRKLQHAQNRCKKLEAQLIRAEQKYDRDSMDFNNNRKEYISKITYLRSTVQDLRHKYTGAIPLRQQERFSETRERLAELKKELTRKLAEISAEKHELEDRIAEYEARVKSIEMLKNAAIVGADGSVRFNEKFLDSFKKSENLRMLNLKLERANRRYRDEIKFLEDLNRKYEITIIGLEEENLRLENDFDAKMLIWEHREADLERTADHLRKQHQMIESLAISFEEISGNMPDPSLPIANQLDQAMNIIRSHIKLLAEAKIQADLAKKKNDELEQRVRNFEHEINIRDKAIAELRLRLPATMERDILIQSSMTGGAGASGIDTSTSVRAAQSTIESLQNRLKQKDDSIAKYQDLLKLAREEITKINKQHELEINNMIDKLNLTRDTSIQKLRAELKSSSHSAPVTSRAQLARLQELEEVTVEQDNTISALNQKVKHLSTECDTWKARFEMKEKQYEQDLAKAQKDQMAVIERLNAQLGEYRAKIGDQEQEMGKVLNDLQSQKQLSSKSPSAAIKSMVDKLKQQLAEKEEQQRALNQALLDLKGDMVNIAKSNLTAHADGQSQEERMKAIIESKIAEYQDKLCAVGEELAKCKKELKAKSKQNEELQLELEHLRAQLKTKDQRIKKLSDEVQKMADDHKSAVKSNMTLDSKAGDVEYLKRQIRTLEDKLRRQKMPAEKPFETTTRPTSKSPKRAENECNDGKYVIKTASSAKNKAQNDAQHTLRHELEQWKTRYNYVLSENAILLRERNDLQVEIARLAREADPSAGRVLGENKMLRDELERLKAQLKARNSANLATSARAESKERLSAELQKLRLENEKLRERLGKVDELNRVIEFLKMENERLRNDDASVASSTSTTSNLRRIGESGKSNVELEKTIQLMKKLIVKQQKEIDALKGGSKT